MTFDRAFGGSEPERLQPIGRRAAGHDERRVTRSEQFATGTLACPSCDAPVLPRVSAMSPADLLGCPFCRHSATVRDFLSLRTPTRPARVALRVVQRTD